MKKIVFIIYLPLTKKIEKDFYIMALLKNNIKVEYWDISNIYFPDLKLIDSIERNYTIKVKNFREFHDLAIHEDKKETLFITQITFEWKVWKLFRLLTKNGCELGIFARGMLPLPGINERRKWIDYLSYKKIIKHIKYRIHSGILYLMKSTGYIKTYDVIFYAGEEGYKTIGMGCKADIKHAEKIPINYFDYDNTLIAAGEKRIIDKRYFVFLDEYLPYHPDYKMSKIPTVDPENYYRILNSFFDSLENKFNLKIVIAAHPKASYSDNPFGGREVFKYKTNELVRDSELVLAHKSSAISFAIIYQKPVMFLYYKEFEELYHNSFMKVLIHFSKKINARMVPMDNPDLDKMDIFSVDKVCYDWYKYNYLTSPESEKTQTEEIFIEYLKRR